MAPPTPETLLAYAALVGVLWRVAYLREDVARLRARRKQRRTTAI